MQAIEQFKKTQTHLIAKLGEGNAHMVWALGLLVDSSDLIALASQAITDGGNDKKFDFFFIDDENRKIIFGQAYYADKLKDQAPANKASDLNTAVAWLISGEIDVVTNINDRVKKAILLARSKIKEGLIDEIQIVYIHNNRESLNVEAELKTCAKALQTHLTSNDILVKGIEFGLIEQERLFIEKDTHILVKDSIPISTAHFSEKGSDWEAQTFTVTGEWLRALYLAHDDKLFSANYRGFLGIGRKKNKINNAISQSGEKTPSDFWAFNNGITILTHEICVAEGKTYLRGMSIINGAQTTGSLGSIDSKILLDGVKVLCRAVICQDTDKARLIVKYNNTQNSISSWDQYSNDADQKYLVRQFKDLGNFTYSLKRGFEATEADLGIEMLAQPSLAFQGYVSDANRGKNSVFDSKELYKRAFDGKNARQLLLAYCFGRAIDERKLLITNKVNRTDKEESQLNLFNFLSFKNFLLAVVGLTLESHLGIKVNIQQVSLSGAACKQGINHVTSICSKIVARTLIYTESEMNAFPGGPSAALKDAKNLTVIASAVSNSIASFYEDAERNALVIESIYTE
jgi:hypothetical protein